MRPAASSVAMVGLLSVRSLLEWGMFDAPGELAPAT